MGASDPIPGLSLPLDQTEGLHLSDNIADPTPLPRVRAPDSGSGTTGYGGRAPTFTNSWARRTTWGNQ